MKSISCNTLNLLVRREGEIQSAVEEEREIKLETNAIRAGVGAACVIIIVSSEKVAFIIHND